MRMSYSQVVQMSNYCGIGIDAELSLDFHQAREEEPRKFTSRCHRSTDGSLGLHWAEQELLLGDDLLPGPSSAGAGG